MRLLDLPPELILEVLDVLTEFDKQCLRITCRTLKNMIPLWPKLEYKDDGEPLVFSDESLRRRWFPLLMLLDNNLYDRSLKFEPCVGCLRIGMPWRFPLRIFGIDGLHVCGDCLTDIFTSNHAIFEGIEKKPTGYCWRCGDKPSDPFLLQNFERPATQMEIGGGDYHKDICDRCLAEVIWRLTPPGHKIIYEDDDWYVCLICARYRADSHTIFYDREFDALDPISEGHCISMPGRPWYERICVDCHWQVCENPRECRAWSEEVRKDFPDTFYNRSPDGRCYDCGQWHGEEDECYRWEDIDKETGLEYYAFPPAAGPPTRQLTLDSFFNRT